MHPPDSSTIQSNLETVGDHVHLVVTLRSLAALDQVPELPPPCPAFVGLSLVQDSLPVDRHLLQRADQDTYTKAESSSEH